MIAIPLILIASIILLIVFKEAKTLQVKVAVTLLCLPALLPNTLLLMEYAVNPLTGLIKGEVLSTDGQPIAGMPVIIKYKMKCYTLVSDSDITRKIAYNVTDSNGKFVLIKKLKPLPCALMPLYIEKYNGAEVVLPTYKYKAVRYVITDRYPRQPLSVKLELIQSGNEFIENVCSVYYSMFDSEEKFTNERTNFLKLSMNYFESNIKDQNLTRENIKEIYNFYLKLGDSGKASFFKERLSEL